MTEPWLRGPLPDIDPIVAPVLYSFQHAREDLATYTEGLSNEEIWSRPQEITSLGFHIRHMGGSVARLCAYLEGRQLTPEELERIPREGDPGAGRDELLSNLNAEFVRCERLLRGLNPGTLRDRREVGRNRLPTTVIGLVVHLAEHTQRHLGQAITTAKLLHARKQDLAQSRVNPG
jgi:hypothetical protein